MKLWEKGYVPNPLVEQFTVGKDPELDMELVPYDILASKAHSRVLHSAGVLQDDELTKLVNSLEDIYTEYQQGKFSISVSEEDCHTAIENQLTQKLGDLGKKIHTARSRNDQVLTAMRLFEMDAIGSILSAIDSLIGFMKTFADSNTDVPMPGYTHTRKAMPFSVKDWMEAFIDSLYDDKKMLNAVLDLIDQNPLGTGAGFGVPFPLDRSISQKELGFNRSLDNPLYAQNSRGKFESQILSSCQNVLMTLNRMSTDLILFTMPEFGFFTIEDSLTTGSSIMPHKKNPDVLELVRASVHQLTGYQVQVQNTYTNLISGYHRDVQFTKEPLMNGLKLCRDSVEVFALVMQACKPNTANLSAAMSDELYTVQKVYDLVKKGIPFREAYKIIASQFFNKKS